MSGLLMRRRAMMQTAGTAPVPPAETWDYEWDYSQGLLSANGWKKTISGNGSETLGTNGVRLLSGGSQDWCRLEKLDYKAATVVMLLECDIPSITDGANNLRLCVSNGTNGIQIIQSAGYWRLLTADKAQYGTAIKPFATGEHTVRLQLDNGVGAVWIDGEMCASNVPTSSILYSARTIIMSQGQQGYSVIKSVKLKKNRL